MGEHFEGEVDFFGGGGLLGGACVFFCVGLRRRRRRRRRGASSSCSGLVSFSFSFFFSIGIVIISLGGHCRVVQPPTAAIAAVGTAGGASASVEAGC
jgi:hypothetical protein